MENHSRRWSKVLGLALWALAVYQPAKAEPLEPMTVSVLMIDQTGLAESMILRAEAEATRIYRALGVDVIWVKPDSAAANFDLTVKIVSQPLSTKEVATDALGVAAGTRTARGKTAYAFCRRIEEFSARHSVDAGRILGHVIAHELGHLLLPYNAHARSGIMTGGWDDAQATRASRGVLAFSAAESTQIRETLQREHSDR
jgi:hypothetical protein